MTTEQLAWHLFHIITTHAKERQVVLLSLGILNLLRASDFAHRFRQGLEIWLRKESYPGDLLLSE